MTLFSSLFSNVMVPVNPTSAFTPLSLPNTVYWHDISDLSTMWQDSAKTTPVTGDGDPVGYIEDKSGNGHDLHQTTSGNRPILRIVGGLYKLEYNGATSNRWLESVNTIDLTGTNAVSICTAVTANSGASTQMIAEFSVNGGTNNGGWYLYLNTLARYITFGKGTLAASATKEAVSAVIAPPNTRVLIGLNPIDDFSKIRANAVETTASSDNKGTGNYGNHKFYLGNRAGSSLPFDGDIYQNFLTSDILSGTDLTNVENFLAEKSGESF